MANSLALTSTVIEITGTILVFVVFYYHKKVKGVNFHALIRNDDWANTLAIPERDAPKRSSSIGETDVHEVEMNIMQGASAGEVKRLKARLSELEKKWDAWAEAHGA